MAQRRRSKGEGSIEQIPCGHYRGIVSLGTKPDGRRDKRTKTFHTKREAQKWIRQQLHDRDRGKLTHDDRMTLGEWLARWLAYKQARVEPGTFEGMDCAVRLYIQPHLGLVRLGNLKPSHITHFLGQLEQQKVGRGRQRNIGAALRQCLREAVSQSLLPTSPMDRIRLPKYTPPEHSFWTATEVGRFRQACQGHRLEALFVLALDTGMRIGELIALHWDEVDLGHGTVRIAHSYARGRRKAVKTKSSRRRLRLSGEALAALRRHRERYGYDAGPVFRGRTGTYLVRAHVDRFSFRKLIEAAGVTKIRLHDLRHTHATLALANGASLRAVSVRLGHSSPSITLNVYAHCLPEQDAAITEFWGGLLQLRAREVARNGEEE